MGCRNQFCDVVKLTVSSLVFIWTGACQSMIHGRLIDRHTLTPIKHPHAKINVVHLFKKRQNIYLVSVDDHGEFQQDLNENHGKILLEALVPGYKTSHYEFDLEHSQGKKIVFELTPIQEEKIMLLDINPSVTPDKSSGQIMIMPPDL